MRWFGLTVLGIALQIAFFQAVKWIIEKITNSKSEEGCKSKTSTFIIAGVISTIVVVCSFIFDFLDILIMALACIAFSFHPASWIAALLQKLIPVKEKHKEKFLVFSAAILIAIFTIILLVLIF